MSEFKHEFEDEDEDGMNWQLESFRTMDRITPPEGRPFPECTLLHALWHT